MFLTQEQAQEVIDLYILGLTILELCDEFKVCQTTIKRIILGKSHKHCNRPNDIKKVFESKKNKLTERKAQEIINRYIEGESSSSICKDYNIRYEYVSKIVSGKVYKQCTRPININIKELLKRHNSGVFIDHISLTQRQMNIIAGSLLGDGSISPRKYFIKPQRLICKEYLDWHYEELKPFSARLTERWKKQKINHLEKGNSSFIEIPKYLWGHAIETHTHACFTELRQKWYPDGIKIIPKDIELTPLTLAIWMCDDGSNHAKHGRNLRLHTNCFTFEDVNFLKEKLFSTFNIESRIKTYRNNQPELYIFSDSYATFMDLVIPHIVWNCFDYKNKKRELIQVQSKDLSDDIVMEIIELRNKGLERPEINEIFPEIKGKVIQNIINGKTFKHLQHLNKNPYKLKKYKYKCVETGEIFSSMTEAGKKYGLHKGSIQRAVVNFPNGTSCGLHWEKID